jgi:hypothetical protein
MKAYVAVFDTVSPSGGWVETETETVVETDGSTTGDTVETDGSTTGGAVRGSISTGGEWVSGAGANR